MIGHLSMEQLIALRDGDRSEPGLAEAQRHLTACSRCQVDLDRLHQRTARLRALPILVPAGNEFPAVRQRMAVERRQRHWRAAATVGLAAAAALVLTVIGRDIVHPTRLDAEQQLQTAMSKSAQLEQRLRDWNSDQRVIDGQTAIVVIQLEDKIADLDARLQVAAKHLRSAPTVEELKLWQQRVGLMNALVDVHLTNASSVGL
jgi:anti-sigma factor RsiW